jgi:hypothetical protein
VNSKPANEMKEKLRNDLKILLKNEQPVNNRKRNLQINIDQSLEKQSGTQTTFPSSVIMFNLGMDTTKSKSRFKIQTKSFKKLGKTQILEKKVPYIISP